MLQYTVCMQTYESNKNKMDKLNSIYNDYFNQPGINKCYTMLVANYIQLLGNYMLKLDLTKKTYHFNYVS